MAGLKDGQLLPRQVIVHDKVLVGDGFVWHLHHNDTLLAKGRDATLSKAHQAAFDALEAAGLERSMESTLHSTERQGPRICASCGEPIEQPATGRPKIYCSSRCRVRAWRRREEQHHAEGSAA